MLLILVADLPKSFMLIKSGIEKEDKNHQKEKNVIYYLYVTLTSVL